MIKCLIITIVGSKVAEYELEQKIFGISHRLDCTLRYVWKLKKG